MVLRLGLLGPRLGLDGPGMGPVGDEVILSNFPHALMCVEDAQAKCFGLKERELVPRIEGRVFMQVSNISHVNSFAEALAILRCWFLTFTNMLVC